MTVASSPRVSLADLLLKEGVISEEQRDEALGQYDRSRQSLVRILSDMGVLTEELRLKILKKNCSCEMVSLRNVVPSEEVGRDVTRDMCRKAHAVPLRITEGAVVLAMEDPTDVRTIGDFEKAFGRTIRPVLAASAEINEVITRLPESDLSESFREIKPPSLAHKAASTTFLAVLVFGPILSFLYYIARVPSGIEWYGSFEFDRFASGLVFLIGGGSWAAIAYFLTDLIFGRPTGSE